jgi:hypothetical protein
MGTNQHRNIEKGKTEEHELCNIAICEGHVVQSTQGIGKGSIFCLFALLQYQHKE